MERTSPGECCHKIGCGAFCHTPHPLPHPWFFEIRFLCIALAILELHLLTKLPSNSEIPCPCLSSAGLKGVCNRPSLGCRMFS